MIEEHTAAAPQNTLELGIRLLEVGDVDEDVSTPDEIDGAAFDGKRFGGAEDELDLML